MHSDDFIDAHDEIEQEDPDFRHLLASHSFQDIKQYAADLQPDQALSFWAAN